MACSGCLSTVHRSTVVALTGNSSTPPGGVIFMGDDTHLLSASGDKLTVWDLHQLTRIATQATMTMPYACTACPPPLIHIRPDGKAIAVLSGTQDLLNVRSLGPSGQERIVNGSYTRLAGAPTVPHWCWSKMAAVTRSTQPTRPTDAGTVESGPYGQLEVRYPASGHLERVIGNSGAAGRWCHAH